MDRKAKKAKNAAITKRLMNNNGWGNNNNNNKLNSLDNFKKIPENIKNAKNAKKAKNDQKITEAIRKINLITSIEQFDKIISYLKLMQRKRTKSIKNALRVKSTLLGNNIVESITNNNNLNTKNKISEHIKDLNKNRGKSKKLGANKLLMIANSLNMSQIILNKIKNRENVISNLSNALLLKKENFILNAKKMKNHQIKILEKQLKVKQEIVNNLPPYNLRANVRKIHTNALEKIKKKLKELKKK